MTRILCLVAFGLFAAWGSAAAESFDLGSGHRLEMSLPGDRWTVAREAPAFLIEETAEHLEHELSAQGRSFTDDRLLELAQKRLAANELFVFNPGSGAVLTIDFSPLRDDEDAPSRRSIASSARFAGQGLEEEEGVSDVEYEVNRTEVPGARYAYRVDASYRHHDEGMKFVGIIGFRQPDWFYFYYQDRLRDAKDFASMKTVFESLRLQPQTGR